MAACGAAAAVVASGVGALPSPVAAAGGDADEAVGEVPGVAAGEAAGTFGVGAGLEAEAAGGGAVESVGGCDPVAVAGGFAGAAAVVFVVFEEGGGVLESDPSAVSTAAVGFFVSKLSQLKPPFFHRK